MDKKTEFKQFVKENPKLIKYVKSGEMTWQKFYEIYDIYGSEENAWKDYLAVATTTAAASAFSFSDVMGWLKGINMDSVQTGIGNLQRVIGMVQDLTGKDTKDTKKEEYKPRPLYRHFDD